MSAFVSRFKLLLTFLHVLLLFTIFISSSFDYLILLVLVYSFFLLVEARHNILKLFSVMILVYANFSIIVLRYWNPDVMIVNEGITEKWIDIIGLKCLALFTLVLYVVSCVVLKKEKKHPPKKEPFKSTRNNPLLVIFSCLILIIIWVFFYDFSINSGDRSGYHPIYEYSTVFFILGFWYSGNKKWLKRLVLLLAVFYILFDFLGGQRSTGVQIGIIVLLMVFYEKLNIKRIVVLAIVGLVLAKIVALYRSDFSTQSINMAALLGDGSYAAVASGTSGMAYYTSLTFIGTTQFYSSLQRLGQFFEFLISQIIVGTVGKPVTELALEHYTHYYGGILPIYLYYYLGYFGAFLISVLVSKYYSIMDRIMYEKHSALASIIAIYVSITTLRWYQYSPNQLLRGVLLLSISFIVFSEVDRFTTNRRLSQKKLNGATVC